MNAPFWIGIGCGCGIACFYLAGINAMSDSVKPRRKWMVYAVAFFLVGLLTGWLLTKI